MPMALGARKGRDTSSGWLLNNRMPAKAVKGTSTKKPSAGEETSFRLRAAHNRNIGRKKYSAMG